eukprot:TRINITY_DN40846_c0_g1_i1.p2 TRINITY_DN40846_c0_g1~~TRINITY_DN40846_c0_g1_i1.p2  ORF type:complete len:155 (-),score=23.22 TRINITY_DN40846_c0_g1_i1:15-479(-)
MKAVFFLLGLALIASCKKATKIEFELCDPGAGYVLDVEFGPTKTHIVPETPEIPGSVHAYLWAISSKNEDVKEVCYKLYWGSFVMKKDCAAEAIHLTAGTPFTMDKAEDIPSYVPKGHFKIQAVVHSTAGEELFCINAKFQVTNQTFQQTVQLK